jgi:hypothetical protein
MSRSMLCRALVAAGALAAVAAGCERTPDRPIARLAASPVEVALAYPGAAEIELAWQPLVPLGEVDGELRVFIHLLDGEGEIARTFDHRYPFAWEVGRPQQHRLELYQSVLGPPLPAGDYALTAGLYDAAGRRWALATTREEAGRREYHLATVRVAEPPAPPAGGVPGPPELGFAGGWLPLEPGADRQILGRRWMTGDAAIGVGMPRVAGELVVSIAILPPPPGVELRLDEGAAQPAVRVTSDCDGSSHHLAGVGSHEIAVGVAAQAICRVNLEPSFEVDWPEGPPRAATLEKLYWRSANGG